MNELMCNLNIFIASEELNCFQRAAVDSSSHCPIPVRVGLAQFAICMVVCYCPFLVSGEEETNLYIVGRAEASAQQPTTQRQTLIKLTH